MIPNGLLIFVIITLVVSIFILVYVAVATSEGRDGEQD